MTVFAVLSSPSAPARTVLVGGCVFLVAGGSGCGTIGPQSAAVDGRGVESNPGERVGGDDGSLHALDGRSGAVLWAYWLGVTIKTSPASSANALLVTDYDGNLYAFVAERS